MQDYVNDVEVSTHRKEQQDDNALLSSCRPGNIVNVQRCSIVVLVAVGCSCELLQ